jgi:aspartate kinase
VAGITNELIVCAQTALTDGDKAALTTLAQIKKNHLALIEELFSNSTEQQNVIVELDPFFSQLEVLLRGVGYLKELSKRTLDAISGFGELFSTKIFAMFAHSQGLSCQWVDARHFLITDDNFGRATPLWEQLVPKTKDLLSPFLTKKQCVVTQGFIGTTKEGVSTTLGRGGSDYTASIIGVALDATAIEIWTDVDGMMTADPRIVKEATSLSEVSFQEASELAYFGAKVLHPLTIKPAVEKNIAVRILNTMKPLNPGTLITAIPEREPRSRVSSIAIKKNLSAIFISSPRMLMAHGFLAKVFEIFSRNETSIDLIATSEVSVSLTIDNDDHLSAIKDELSELGEVNIFHNVAIVTVVGRQFRNQSGIAGQVFGALKDINIIMISGGASDINLSFVVDNKDADQSVKFLHREFFGAPVLA